MGCSRRIGVATALVALLALAASSHAQLAPHTLEAHARVTERGWVRLDVLDAAGPVTVTETTGGVAEPLPTLPGPTTVEHLVPWRCDRLTRTFALADAAGHTATTSTTTPGCAHRLTLGRRSGRAGHGVGVTVRDRFGVGGVDARVCLAPPGRRLACRALTIAPGKRSVTVRFSARVAGRYRLRVRTTFGQTIVAAVRVRRRGGHFRLLATGDSMIQIIDGDLKQRLAPRGRVTSDAHISTGISKPFMFDWVKHARASARSVHPDVTVMFLGANDGFPIGGAQCCGHAWVVAYAKRVRTMVASYLRGGRGRVYWMLLPTPGKPQFARVFRAVNRALERTARGFSRAQLRLIDLRRTFTPHGFTPKYRQPDRVHLNVAGAQVAAGVIVRRLRADGYL